LNYEAFSFSGRTLPILASIILPVFWAFNPLIELAMGYFGLCEIMTPHPPHRLNAFCRLALLISTVRFFRTLHYPEAENQLSTGGALYFNYTTI